MIVAVKTNRKQKIVRYLSLFFVLCMLIAYYFYMSAEYQKKEAEQLKQKQAMQIKKDKENKKNRLIEKTLLSEIEKSIDLLGQENVKNVKIIENKVVIVCEPNTNLEALMVRYGTMALTKKTVDDILIAIDIGYIIKSKLDVN